jgi:hypothetical protein
MQHRVKTLNFFVYTSHKSNCTTVQRSSGSKQPVPINIPEISYILLQQSLTTGTDPKACQTLLSSEKEKLFTGILIQKL